MDNYTWSLRAASSESTTCLRLLDIAKSSLQVVEKLARREEIIQHLDSILHDDAFLVVPSAPGPAPKLNTPASELEGFRSRLLALTCIAGVAKLPQVAPQIRALMA